jgi:hypothetical protein
MRSFVALAGLLVVQGGGPAAPENAPDLGLPDALRAYRSWTPLLSQPRQVTASMWGLCRSPTLGEGRAQALGPHTTPMVMVFGTPDVAIGRGVAERQPLPLGAMIAKEKLLTRDGPANGVAFMVKREPPAFRDSGGWEFLYFPGPADPAEARRTHEHCAACHRAAAGSDYVFRAYGVAREEGGAR